MAPAPAPFRAPEPAPPSAPPSAPDAARGRGRRLGPALALAFCAAAMAALSLVSPGQDLLPLWIAGRLTAEGLHAAPYAFDPAAGIAVTHPDWARLAAEIGHAEDTLSFVFPPLWAQVLGLTAGRLDWPAFQAGMAILDALAMAGMLAICVRLWAPAGLGRRVLTLSAVAAPFVWPSMVSAIYNQVHPLVMCAALGALLLAERARPGAACAAGFLLALAASLKITPAFFGVYWLIAGRWRAAGWAAAWGAALFALNLAAAGPGAQTAFMELMGRLAGGVATSTMNQSALNLLSALLHGLREPVGAAPIAGGARIAAALMGWGLVAAAAIRHLRTAPGARDPRLRLLPAVLVGALLAAPIAWIYYFAFLTPLIVALAFRLRRGPALAAGLLALLAARPAAILLGPAWLAEALAFSTTLAALATALLALAAPELPSAALRRARAQL